VVTGSSPASTTPNATSPVAIFGGVYGNWEPQNILFQDGKSESFVHWAEWQTTAPVTIGAFNLWATPAYQQSPDPSDPHYARRSFARFRLFAWNGSSFQKVFDDAPVLPYYLPPEAPSRLPFSITLDQPVSAQKWRVEFSQQVWTSSYNNISAGYYGPRIVEFDGFAPVPEAATLSLLVVGGLVFMHRGRRTV
jgi:hypothetical protein